MQCRGRDPVHVSPTVIYAAQALVEGLLKEYPNTLVLRVRMPIVADLVYPRNFVTKIIKYEKVRWTGRRSTCRDRESACLIKLTSSKTSAWF